jgi:hypothetical protein
MREPGTWQSETIGRLGSILEPDEAVLGLAVIGSLAQPDMQTDEWSDLDIVLVARDAALSRFWPSTEWLDCLGETYASSVAEDRGLHTVRMWYQDGRHVDVGIVTESNVEEFTRRQDCPLRFGCRVVFSRSHRSSAAFTAAASGGARLDSAACDLDGMSNDFWFKGMLAVSKVARNDLLVALHLTLDLIRDCCVLGMLLRDREAGTRHHRCGRPDDPFVRMLERTQQPYTALGILDAIEQSAVVFEDLAARLVEGYEPRRQPLLEAVARARRSLAGTETVK